MRSSYTNPVLETPYQRIENEMGSEANALLDDFFCLS